MVEMARNRRKSPIPTFVSTSLTGLTNASVNLVLYAASGANVLGAWALATTPLTIALAVQRLVLAQSALRGGRIRASRHGAVLLVVLAGATGLSSAVVCVCFGVPTMMLLMAIASPAILLQDAYRMRQFGLDRASASASSDFTWFATSVVLLIVALGLQVPIEPAVVAAYAGGAIVAATHCAMSWPVAGDCTPSKANPLHVAGEGIAVVGLSNLAQIVVAATVSLSVLGQLRLAATIVQPVMLVNSFAQSYLVPRLAGSDDRRLRHGASAAALCAATGVCCIVGALVVAHALPGWIGVADLPQLLLTSAVLAAAIAFGSLMAIVMVAVRDTRPARVWVTCRLVGSVADPIVSIPAGVLLGAPGLAFGPLANNSALLASIAVSESVRREKSDAFN